MKKDACFDIARDGRSRFVFSAMSSRMHSHSAVTIENGNRVTAAVTIATALFLLPVALAIDMLRQPKPIALFYRCGTATAHNNVDTCTRSNHFTGASDFIVFIP